MSTTWRPISPESSMLAPILLGTIGHGGQVGINNVATRAGGRASRGAAGAVASRAKISLRGVGNADCTLIGEFAGLEWHYNTCETDILFGGQDSMGRGTEEGFRTLQVTRKQPFGPSTVLETMIEGTKVSLLQLQLKMVHTLIKPLPSSDQTRSKPAGRIAFITGSDLQSRHRLTMESTLGSEGDKHSLSTVISSDLHSRMSWGLASSLNVNEKLVIFSRYNNDAYAGQRLIVQAVSKVDERNTVSPICSSTLGKGTQGGLSWTHAFHEHVQGADNESIQLKALCSSNGSYMVSVKAQMGNVEC